MKYAATKFGNATSLRGGPARIQEERRHCEERSDDQFAGSEFGRTKCARRAGNRTLPVNQALDELVRSLGGCRVGLRPPRNDIGANEDIFIA